MDKISAWLSDDFNALLLSYLMLGCLLAPLWLVILCLASAGIEELLRIWSTS
jgi:hypothetical protein